MASWISGSVSGDSLCLELVTNQHFLPLYCSYRKQMPDQSKTCLFGLVIDSIFPWKHCTRAEVLVQFFPQKFERIKRPTRHVLLHVLPEFSGRSRSISWLLMAWRRKEPIMIFSALLALCEWNPPVTGEFTGRRWIPLKKPLTRSFDVFFDLRLTNGWVNNRDAGDLRRHRAHYDVILMMYIGPCPEWGRNLTTVVIYVEQW